MSVRLPRLLDAQGQERARLSPARLMLDLHITPLSTAEMWLADTEPAVAVRDLIELYDEGGSAGIFRVSAVELEPGLTRRVYLEHSLATLADGVVPATTFTGSARAALTTLLAHQPEARWTLGAVDVSDEALVLFTCGCTNLLTALMQLIELLPAGLMLVTEQAGGAWVMHLRTMDDADACEGRLGRNLADVKITTDAADLCTRVYPYGAGQGTERISLKPLLGVDYLESDTADTWGRVCRTFTAGSIFDVPTLRAVAEKYLERHGQPTVSVVMNGADLSAATGESADSFRLGRMCRLALPESGVVMHERVIALRKPDVIGSPGLVRVTLSSRVHDASDEIADMLREVLASQVMGGRVSDVVTSNRAQGTSASRIEHYFRVEAAWATVLACTATFDPDDGVRVVGVQVDNNPVPETAYADGVFDALPYLRRDSLCVIDAGRHTLAIYPDSGAVNSTVSMKVIEKI